VTDNDNDNRTTSGDTEGRGGLTPRLRWGIAAVLALVSVVAVVAIVLEVVSLRPRHRDIEAEQQSRADVVRAAERFTVQVNNYGVDGIDGYEKSITPMLSPKFKGEFDKAMQDIVASVKQAKMSSKGQVLASAVASVDPDSAQVLVVADSQVKTVFDTRARHFRWEVSLVKLNGSWLVDDFSPVA